MTGYQDCKVPLPTAEEVFTKLYERNIFSDIDLSDAYLEVEVEEESKKFLTIHNTKVYFAITNYRFVKRSPPPSSNKSWIPGWQNLILQLHT